MNHFAARRGHPGGTRHVELFGRLVGWEHVILAANRNLLTGSVVESAPGFLAVPVTKYTSNGPSRILNWASYALTAFIRGLTLGKVDVVYASSPHLLAGLAGWALALAKRAHFVLEVRDLWPQVLVDMRQVRETSLVYRALVSLEAFLYTRADEIVVMAEGTHAALLARGIPAGKINYIPNGADSQDFVPSASRETLRQKYGFTVFTAIYAGAHGPANGLELVLEAASGLLEEPIEIVLVGAGVRKDALRQEAARRGLNNVTFLDPVPKDEIPDLLCAADLGLHVLSDVALFRSSVSPNKVFDYMASGLPVLTNSPGVVGDLVRAAGCGFAVAPSELGTGLAQCYESQGEAELRALGNSGREWLDANQSRRAMRQRLRTVLDELIQVESTQGAK